MRLQSPLRFICLLLLRLFLLVIFGLLALLILSVLHLVFLPRVCRVEDWSLVRIAVPTLASPLPL